MKNIKIVGFVDGMVTGSTYEIGVDMSEEIAEKLVEDGVAVDATEGEAPATEEVATEEVAADAAVEADAEIEVEAPVAEAETVEGAE